MTEQIKETADISVEGDRRDADDGRAYTFKLTYEGVERSPATNDRIVDGRKIMRLGDIEPADDHVLIEVKRPGSRSVGLDEDVDLGEPGREEFWAFASDRVFNFTVDRLGYEWGAARISEPELRDIAGVPEGKVLVLEREDEPDDVIEPDQIVDLGERGTEHIRIEKHPDTFEIKIIYNGLTKSLKVSLSETMAAVRERALALFSGIESPHLLSLFDKAGNELQDGQTVKSAKVRKGDKLLLRPSTVRAG